MFGKKSNKRSAEEIRKAAKNLSKGGAEAFRALYEKYNANVYRFCLRMLGDESMAKDAFQETFIKVYEKRETFKGENFAAWLFTIARHTCLNAIRAAKDHDAFDETFHFSVKAQPADTGMKDCLAKAVETLPELLKEAFLLREYEEMTYKEVAEVLGIDLSLAKVRVHRARVILRKLLAPLRKELYES